MTQKVWMTLHEVSHTLLEGSSSLVAKGAITEYNRQDLLKYGECLNRKTPVSNDNEIENLFQRSYIYHNAKQTHLVGRTFADIAIKKCDQETKFLSFWVNLYPL